MRQEYARRHRHHRDGHSGTLLHAPDCYMDKIAIGPGYPKGTIDLDAPADENILSSPRPKA